MYTAALNGFAGTLNAGQLTALRHNANVAYIEQDARVTISATQTGAPSRWTASTSATFRSAAAYTYVAPPAGVNAYVVDRRHRFLATPAAVRAVPAVD